MNAFHRVNCRNIELAQRKRKYERGDRALPKTEVQSLVIITFQNSLFCLNNFPSHYPPVQPNLK
jgi:hypothetical protein